MEIKRNSEIDIMETLTNLKITEHETDGELRCRDLDLAEKLGYVRERDIRKLIATHLDMLSEFGLVRQTVAPIKSGRGRVQMVAEYHLNRKQAIYITTQCRAPKARALTVFVVEVSALE